MRYETEKTLLIGIALNELKLDLNKLNPKCFEHFGQTLQVLKESIEPDGLINPAKVGRKSKELTLTDIREAQAEYFKEMYFASYKEYLTFNYKTYMKEVIDQDLTAEQMKRLNELHNEVLMVNPDVEIDRTDYGNYFEVVSKRATEKQRMFYGIPKLDMHTGGIHKKEFTVLAARPSVGKSTLALQIAENVAKTSKVLFVSCEMSWEQVMDRRILRHTTVDPLRLKSGKLTKDEFVKISLAVDDFNKSKDNFKFLEKTHTLNGVKTAITKYQPNLVIIDYVTLLKNGKYNSKREEVASITRELKMLTLSEEIAIIGLAQVNRGGDGRKPCLADLKESGTLEEDADVVIMLHTPDSQDDDYAEAERAAGTLTPMMILLSKNRNGNRGVIFGGFDGERYKFKEPYMEG